MDMPAVVMTRLSTQYRPVVPYYCHFWQVSLAYAFWLSNQTGKRYRVFKSGVCWRVEETAQPIVPTQSLTFYTHGPAAIRAATKPKW